MALAHILRRPIITEKQSQGTSGSRFIFKVDRQATKGQVRQAVEDTYGVSVTKINTMIMPGKTRRVGRNRHLSQSSSWKKAIVHLKSGDNIDIFEIKEDK